MIHQINQILALNKPPLLYDILQSIANLHELDVDPSNISSLTRSYVFDFTYPLSTSIEKEEFEELILDHFLMRRIEFDTMTAFKLYLKNKMRTIMPFYNKLFDVYNDFTIFDGENIIRSRTEGEDVTGSNSLTSNVTEDLRHSATPQNDLSNVRSGKYVSDYDYNSNNTTNTGSITNNREMAEEETITKTTPNKVMSLREYLDIKSSIYERIFDDLSELFLSIGVDYINE